MNETSQLNGQFSTSDSARTGSELAETQDILSEVLRGFPLSSRQMLSFTSFSIRHEQIAIDIQMLS